MNSIATKGRTQMCYKDGGAGQPAVFGHGWRLDYDAWIDPMFLFASSGYRCIGADRRGQGGCSRPWVGNDSDTYIDDFAAVAAVPDLKVNGNIGHTTGGGEVVRYGSRHGTKRVATVALVSDIPRSLLLTTLALRSSKNVRNAKFVVYAGGPHGLPATHKDGRHADLLAFACSVTRRKSL